jgi:hypothetical protein
MGMPAAATRQQTQGGHLSEDDKAALSALTTDVMAGCQAEATAMRRVDSETKRRSFLSGFLGIMRAIRGASQKFLNIRRALGSLQEGLRDSGTYRYCLQISALEKLLISIWSSSNCKLIDPRFHSAILQSKSIVKQESMMHNHIHSPDIQVGAPSPVR